MDSLGLLIRHSPRSCLCGDTKVGQTGKTGTSLIFELQCLQCRYESVERGGGARGVGPGANYHGELQLLCAIEPTCCCSLLVWFNRSLNGVFSLKRLLANVRAA